MKIMFILTTYEKGGVSTVARNLLHSMAEEKLNLVLLAERLSGEHYPFEEGIKIIDLKVNAQRNFLFKMFNIVRHLSAMRRSIREESPDVIISFASQVNCYTLLSLSFGFRNKPKVIITEHSEEMFLRSKNSGIRYEFSKIFYRTLMMFLYPRAEYIIAVSGTIARHVKRMPFVSKKMVRTIHNPIVIDDIRKLSLRDDLESNIKYATPCVATISRLSSEKGVHFLIQGFKILLEKMDAHLVIIGGGVERPLLERMSKSLGIEEKVTFTGWMDNPFKHLKKTDIFVLPSLWEGFPMAVLEAMACGVPVVAADSSGGIREVIEDGVNGILIEPGSPVAIADSVYALLSNKEKMERMTREAYKGIEEFDVERIKKKYEDLIFN